MQPPQLAQHGRKPVSGPLAPLHLVRLTLLGPPHQLIKVQPPKLLVYLGQLLSSCRLFLCLCRCRLRPLLPFLELVPAFTQQSRLKLLVASGGGHLQARVLQHVTQGAPRRLPGLLQVLYEVLKQLLGSAAAAVPLHCRVLLAVSAVLAVLLPPHLDRDEALGPVLLQQLLERIPRPPLFPLLLLFLALLLLALPAFKLGDILLERLQPFQLIQSLIRLLPL
mmetsp:Transcript_19028/g.40988  ORF Transcript_19028/g.40988 Transcript_19028/m.40988 type:complete len:222 (-) Transcript_19028:1824-2489(-)